MRNVLHTYLNQIGTLTLLVITTTSDVMLCLYDRLKENISLINAHEHPPECATVKALSQVKCDDNESPSVQPGPPQIPTRSYITGGTYSCGSARFLDLSFFNKI